MKNIMNAQALNTTQYYHKMIGEISVFSVKAFLEFFIVEGTSKIMTTNLCLLVSKHQHVSVFTRKAFLIFLS